jgi:hypothetical protein
MPGYWGAYRGMGWGGYGAYGLNRVAPTESVAETLRKSRDL